MSKYKPIIVDYQLCCKGDKTGGYTTPIVIDRDCHIRKVISLGKSKLDTILEVYFVENQDLSRGTAALSFYAGKYEGEIIVRKYMDIYVVERSYLIYDDRRRELLLQINSLPISAKRLYETIKEFVLEEDERKVGAIVDIASKLIPNERLAKIIREAFR